MTTELLMPLDDYILKNPIELHKVEKYLKNLFSRGQGSIGSEPYERKNIKETWFKEIILNSLQNLPQQTFFYAFVDIYPSIVSIKERSQRKPQFCHLEENVPFYNWYALAFITLTHSSLYQAKNWMRKYLFLMVCCIEDNCLFIQTPTQVGQIISLFPSIY